MKGTANRSNLANPKKKELRKQEVEISYSLLKFLPSSFKKRFAGFARFAVT